MRTTLRVNMILSKIVIAVANFVFLDENLNLNV